MSAKHFSPATMSNDASTDSADDSDGFDDVDDVDDAVEGDDQA